ncbi:hypothetical protein [Acinetobacter sp. 1125_18A]|uniref:hypothetical protein n=1 Tax=Acinetobacter sp. 1125_18A TaxID=2605959 RepID=UPI004059165D
MFKNKIFLFLIFFLIFVVFAIVYFFYPSNHSTENSYQAHASTVQHDINKSDDSQPKNNLAAQSQADTNKDHLQHDSDQDYDGVPDRINQFIATEFNDSITLQIAMTDLARSWNLTLQEDLDKTTAKTAANQISKNIACLLSPEVLNKSKKSFEQIQKNIINTRAELLNNTKNTEAYIKFNELVSGQFFPDQGNQNCTNDVVNAPY